MSTDRQLNTFYSFVYMASLKINKNRRVYYLINYTSYFYNASMMIIKYLKIFKNILNF